MIIGISIIWFVIFMMLFDWRQRESPIQFTKNFYRNCQIEFLLMLLWPVVVVAVVLIWGILRVTEKETQ